MHLGSHAGELGINHDSTAILTHNHLLVHLDFHLALWRDTVEAASAGVSLNIDNAQSVARILAYALECGEQAWLNLHLELLGLVAQFLLVLLCLRDDFVQLALLLGKDVLAVGKMILGNLHVGMLLLNQALEIVDLLLGKLNVEVLILDFL